MITLKVFEVFLSVVSGLIQAGLSLSGNAPDVHFQIPAPFFDVFSSFLANVGSSVPMMIAFFLWRQVKA